MLTKLKAKYIQSLSHKKFRDEQNAFIAEGPKIINELLCSQNVRLLELYALQEWFDGHAPVVDRQAGKMEVIRESELERISFQQTPNQVLGVFRKPLFAETIFSDRVTLVLSSIQDPGNLGTIVRTADWFGIENVVCSLDSADVFNPKAVQATMGSLARVGLHYLDLETFFNDHSSLPIYATSLNGKNLFEVQKINEGFILIGNESRGIDEELLRLAAEQITIPKGGHSESLNAAVAAGIVMAQLMNHG